MVQLQGAVKAGSIGPQEDQERRSKAIAAIEAVRATGRGSSPIMETIAL